MQKKCFILLSILSCGLFQASDIFKAIESKNQRVIQSWLKYNPDIEMVNDQGQTVLMKAVLAENKSLVRTLLKKGVSVNVIDRFGRTALDYAVELSNKNIAKLLVKSKGMVTSEVAAVKCEQLLIKKVNVFKVLCACVIGAVGVVLVFPLAVAFVTASAITSVMGGNPLPFLISGLAILGVGTAAVYGSVKFATEEEGCYFIDVLEPSL